MEVNLWDLNNNIYIYVKESFRYSLFKYLIEKAGGVTNLARLLDIKGVSNLYCYKDGEYYLPLRILRKMIRLLPRDKVAEFKKEFQKNILRIKGVANSIPLINPILPIKFCPRLARIAGHILGDGGLFTYKNNITTVGHYTNQCKHLIRQFKNDVIRTFGKVKIYEFYDKRKDAIRLTLPTIIGCILRIFLGPQVGSSKHVPQLIIEADKRSRAMFLRALFDDECGVNLGSSDGSGRSIELTLSNKNVIEEVKKMLKEFGLTPGKIGKKKNLKNGKIYYRFSITGKHDLEKFENVIGFDHPTKKEDLRNMIESYKVDRFKKGELERLVMKLLKENGPLSIYQLAKKLNRKPAHRFRKSLITLEEEGRIKSKRVGMNHLKIYYI